LRRYAAAIVDIQAMDTIVRTLWDHEISVILPEADLSDESNPKGVLEDLMP